MKIYRFVPNGKDHPWIEGGGVERWWPEGIDMGGLGALHPKHPFGDHVPWPHEGNRFWQQWPEQAPPFSDFPPFDLRVPIVSPRAAEVLAEANLIRPPVAITVSGKPLFAVQPTLAQVYPDLPQPFVPSESRALTLPCGEPLLYYRRSFDVAKIAAEFFSIPELEPFSDLYVTEELVEVAYAAKLTGLEYLELVFDDGPVEPRYPPIPRQRTPTCSGRLELERRLLLERCEFWAYLREETEEAIAKAVTEGYVARDFVEPEVRR